MRGSCLHLCFDLNLSTGILGQIVRAGNARRAQNQEKYSRWDVCEEKKGEHEDVGENRE